MTTETEVSALDLTRWLLPTDTVLWGQSSAEPRALTETLVAQRESLSGVRCFLGQQDSGTIRPENADHLRFVGYSAGGDNRALVEAGVFDVFPGPYSMLPALFASRRLSIDVVFVQLSPPDEKGRHSLGLGEEYLADALPHARVVIGEINDQVPRTPGSVTLTRDELTAVIHTSRPPVMPSMPPPSVVEERIGRSVAGLIPDGSTLQIGLGKLPSAILRSLRSHKDLGLHSGLLSDSVIDLIECGALTGARKARDRGVAIAGTVMGSARLFSFLHENPQIGLRPTSYTHAPDVLALQSRFVAINTAIDVDLSGQVNTETVAGRYVGAVGGSPDFTRAAARADDGLSIIALPSTSGRVSRIVDKISGPVSGARSDAGVVVTEHGVADLRGLTLTQRRTAMLAIADPAHRDQLEAATPT